MIPLLCEYVERNGAAMMSGNLHLSLDAPLMGYIADLVYSGSFDGSPRRESTVSRVDLLKLRLFLKEVVHLFVDSSVGMACTHVEAQMALALPENSMALPRSRTFFFLLFSPYFPPSHE